MAGAAKGWSRGAWELLVTSSEVLKGLVLYVTGIP